MQRNIVLRSKVIDSIRRRMHEQGFTEFQTPILTARSPEGARDFLVPSRLHPGKFYALPQAPQQYKQLYMISGFDRYFQIAPCFRDEDARADRSPGRVLPARRRDELRRRRRTCSPRSSRSCTACSRSSARLGGDAAAVPAHPVPRGDAEVRHRQAGPAQPARDRRRDRGLPRLGLQGVRAAPSSKGAVVRAMPAPEAVGRPRSFFDEMVAFAQSAGRAGPGLDRARGRRGQGPDREVPGCRAAAAVSRPRRAWRRRRRVLRLRQAGQAAKLAGPVRDERRRGARPHRQGLLPVLLDRRLPDVRVGRGDQAGHLLAQPVLDAAGRDGGAGDQGPARRSWPTSTTSSATASS